MNANLVVGAKAYIRHWSGSQHSYRAVTVKKITPSGQVVVSFPGFDGKDVERRFNEDLREIGGTASTWNRDELDLDCAAIEARQAEIARKNATVNAMLAVKVNDRVNNHWSKETMLEEVARLEQLLVTARRLADLI